MKNVWINIKMFHAHMQDANYGHNARDVKDYTMITKIAVTGVSLWGGIKQYQRERVT